MAYTKAADYVVNKLGSREVTPGRDAWVIVTSASDQAKYPRALYINTAGAVTGIPIDSPDDTLLTFTFAQGWQPMGFRRITAAPTNTFGVR